MILDDVVLSQLPVPEDIVTCFPISHGPRCFRGYVSLKACDSMQFKGMLTRAGSGLVSEPSSYFCQALSLVSLTRTGLFREA